VAEFNGKQVVRGWRNRTSKDSTIHGLIKSLWVPLKKDGWEYTCTETEEGVLMNCTKCPQYDAAKEFGYEEEWYYFLCFQDAYIAEGYNSKMGFKMTRTLMQGHECCNHFYFMKDER
jgi:predicted ArsR family transcriptional regulator